MAESRRRGELERLQEEFVRAVSHELRTPLTSILGFLELVLDEEAGPLTAEQERYLGVVRRNTDRLARMIDDLLLVARFDAGGVALRRTAVDLAALAGRAVEAGRPEAARHGIELALDVRARPVVEADGARLGQVLDNLVGNALKFTPPGGRVGVVVDAPDGAAVVAVEDSGIGIPARELDRVFDRFFRSARALERAAPGTGLGLSVARAIVDAHGGTVELASVEGEGTTATVTLPRSRAPA